MKLEIFEDSLNYTCSVVEISNLYPLTGLDNLLGTQVFGNQCLVGKNTKIGDKMLFFPSETQLSHKYVSDNNLYRHTELNKDTSKKGFIEDNRRVKAIKFRGHISTGLLTDLSSLPYNLSIGQEFNKIDDFEVCRKYTLRKRTPGQTTKKDKLSRKLARLIPNQFRLHEDTAQLARNLHKFNNGDIIVITAKYHGTSFVCSNILIQRKLKWYEKLLKPFLRLQTTEYANIYSSRKVIKSVEIAGEKNHFYKEDIWGLVNAKLKSVIEPGISIYGEIVGQTPQGRWIQSGYDYGCEPNEFKPVIYRITYTTPQGNVIEFSWQQIKDYCQKYQLEYVKEYFFGAVIDTSVLLKFLSDKYLEKDCELCKNKVPFEGIVVRLDGKRSFEAYKLKSKKFLLRETTELDKGEEGIDE